jgi:hypothetical protein
MDALEEENRMLREELCARDNSYSWCEEKAAVQAKADIVGSGQDSGEGQQDANISVEDSAASTGQQDAGENQAAGDQAGTDGNGLCVVSAAGCNEINDGNGTPHDANNADLNAGFAAIGSSVWGFFSAMFGI